MSADMELSSILNRRQQINEALENGQEIKHTFKVVNIYTEFHEFSRKEIKDYQTTFNRYVNMCDILKTVKTVMTLLCQAANIACSPINLRFLLRLKILWFASDRPISSSGILPLRVKSIKFSFVNSVLRMLCLCFVEWCKERKIFMFVPRRLCKCTMCVP